MRKQLSTVGPRANITRSDKKRLGIKAGTWNISTSAPERDAPTPTSFALPSFRPHVSALYWSGCRLMQTIIVWLSRTDTTCLALCAYKYSFGSDCKINHFPSTATMVSLSKLLALSLLSLASAEPAPQFTDSPTNTELIATFDSKVSGSVAFTSNNGLVLVSVDLSDLPTSGGPFLYHIHKKPVPSDGNCTGTLSHFNPFNGSETASAPDLKEAGDLSGKHGKIEGTSLNTSYIDPYLSLNPSSPAYFGGLSVVVHFANTSRIACANITEKYPSIPSSSGSLKLSPSVILVLIASISAWFSS